jgi:ACS family sodium-dependent inorganic phosphate cotransporter-like MFS transporter 6/7/8
VLSMPVSGVLSDSFGWASCFYFYGVAGILWYMAWLWLSFEKPCLHPTISQEELIYIEESIGNVADNAITVSLFLSSFISSSSSSFSLCYKLKLLKVQSYI